MLKYRLGGIMLKKVFKISSVLTAFCMTIASLGVPQISAELTAEKKSVSQKVIEAVKNNKGKIAFVGGGLLTAAAVAFYGVYGNKCYIEKYINGLDTSDLNVSADDWFKKLGGTTENITDYNNKKNAIKVDEKNIHQIEVDVDRLHDFVDGTWDDTTKKNFKQRVGHILKFWVYKTKKSYTQEMHDYASMVLGKFCECQNNDDYDTKEAKAYYVYDKIMEVIEPNYFGWDDKRDIKDYKLSERMMKVLPKLESVQFKKICDYLELKGYCVEGVFFGTILSFGLRCLEISQVIKMWDRIIFDEEITTSRGFNSEKLRDMIDAFNGKLIIFMFNNRGNNLREKILEKSGTKTLFDHLYNDFSEV